VAARHDPHAGTQSHLLAGSHHSLAGAPVKSKLLRQNTGAIQCRRQPAQVRFFDNSTIT
jgi:hypothetical protein